MDSFTPPASLADVIIIVPSVPFADPRRELDDDQQSRYRDDLPGLIIAELEKLPTPRIQNRIPAIAIFHCASSDADQQLAVKLEADLRIKTCGAFIAGFSRPWINASGQYPAEEIRWHVTGSRELSPRSKALDYFSLYIGGNAGTLAWNLYKSLACEADTSALMDARFRSDEKFKILVRPVEERLYRDHRLYLEQLEDKQAPSGPAAGSPAGPRL